MIALKRISKAEKAGEKAGRTANSARFQHGRLGALIGKTSRHWRQLMDRRLQPFGLTEASWMPLLYLSRAKEPMCQKDLARSVGIDTSTLVRLVDALVQAGLLKRHADTDRRMKILTLTPRGGAVVEKVEKVARGIREELLEGIAESELSLAYDVIERIHARLLQSDERDAAAPASRK